MSCKQFCLKWNNFHSNILSAFESLQNTEDLTDVTLTSEGINIKAHKFILSACSPYFRMVFKENPCSHPIIILKDVLYSDLIAIVNFMYHGEVLVSEEHLASFLQTAKLLQVTGLNNTNESVCRKFPKKSKAVQKNDGLEQPTKKMKILTKAAKKLNDESKESHSNESSKDFVENFSGEINDVLFSGGEKEEQSSILEAALEKPESILERSLMSQAVAKSPSYPQEPLNSLQTFSDVAKAIFIPRKPPESEDSSPSEFLTPTIKIEEDSFENVEQASEEIPKNIDIQQPHHSSQCGNCPHCGKVYSNQSALKYHVRLVHSDLTNMYCCHLCPEAFNYREGYKKHMVEAHCIRN